MGARPHVTVGQPHSARPPGRPEQEAAVDGSCAMTISRLNPLDPQFRTTRHALHLVAIHILARGRAEATGRLGLRTTVGGFGTPAFGDDVQVLRVSGSTLIVERAGPAATSLELAEIDGATLGQLASIAGVDLGSPLDAGSDAPAPPDDHAPLTVDPVAAEQVAGWIAFVDQVLVGVLTARPRATPSAVQLWPEHFDLALDLAVGSSAEAGRVNLGGSCGDEFHGEPYLYVGPWASERPGDPSYWNAPFGAVLPYGELMASEDPTAAAIAFIESGLRHLAPSAEARRSVR